MKKLLSRISRKTLIIIAAVVVFLIAVRITLPYMIKHFVNKELNSLPDYTGSIEDVDLHLFRGAYEIEGIKLEKATGKVPVPFFSATKLDLSVEWGALFEGSVVGEIVFENPKINFVSGPTEEQSQETVDTSWQDIVKDLFPLKINKFEIFNGEIHYRDFYSDPRVDIYLEDVYAIATNLTNSKDLSESLAADIKAKGKAMKSGSFNVEVQVNPYAEQPEFDLNISARNIDLPKLNNFMRAYGNFDVQAGIFSLDGEFAAADGKFEGYIKPIFKDLKVISWKEDHENVFEFLWEAVVGLVAEVFENQAKEQIATRVPLSGRFEDPTANIWSTVGTLIRNAFIEALIPGIERRINLKDVEGE